MPMLEHKMMLLCMISLDARRMMLLFLCLDWLFCLKAFELFLWTHMYASRIKVAIVYAEHSCGTRGYARYQDDVMLLTMMWYAISMTITNVHKCRGPAILKWLVSMGKLRKDGS